MCVIYIMNQLPPILRNILEYDQEWCKMMGYKNPYLHSFKNHLRDYVVTTDQAAYNEYPAMRHVYDKLWVAKTQGLKCGRLEELEGKEEDVHYPIFIKPRYGHLSAASKNCFKIRNPGELKKYKGYEDIMWSDFLPGREGMTDFFMLGGNIVYKLTYLYSPEQHGFSDAWKYVSHETPTPPQIEQWAVKHGAGFTGCMNLQYRDGKIIEVSLRPARAGAYFIATDNAALLGNINTLFREGRWDHSKADQQEFDPYFAFKCHCPVPVLHVWPRTLVNSLMKVLSPHPLHEYYFEPVGDEGVIFMQFVHPSFKKGMLAKSIIEVLFFITQAIALVLYALAAYMLFQPRSGMRTGILIAAVVFFLTRFLNPLFVNYDVFKAYKQFLLGDKSITTKKEYDSRT